MDLKERTEGQRCRHPWELARVDAVSRALGKAMAGRGPLRILDVGCGEGFMLEFLSGRHQVSAVDGFDINLSNDDIVRMSSANKRFFNDPRGLSTGYDVVLMCDVLEHVVDDRAFLNKVVRESAAPGAVFILTVPAHQALFSAHDVFLGHQRRYSSRGFQKVIEGAPLTILEHGSWFLSLLPLRGVECLKEKILGAHPERKKGLGQWQGGLFLTGAVKTMLSIDHMILDGLARHKIRLPGLTLWAVARRMP